MQEKTANIHRFPVINAFQRESFFWFALFCIASIVGIAAFCYGGAQDGDMWWLFATGREIIENGIPYMNPFSVWNDQAIVIQQWIPCVLDYLIYSSFGFIGIGVMVFLLTLALGAAGLFVGRAFTKDSDSPLMWVSILGLVAACSPYLSVRPQVWSMIAFLLIVGVLERYRRTHSNKILIWLPFIIFIHANMHLSMMPFDLVIIVAYWIPVKRFFGYENPISTYPRIPLVTVGVIMIIAACLNPYFVNGFLYVVNSYGAADYSNYINEMQALTPWNTYYGILMVIWTAVGAIGIGRNGRQRVDIPLTLLFFLTMMLSIQHVRNVYMVAIFAFPLFLSAFADQRFHTKWLFLRDDAPKLLIGAVAIVTVLIAGINTQTESLVKEPKDSGSTPIAAMDYISQDWHDNSKPKVFTHFNAGGYVEWRGGLVSMDPRPELWNNNISHTGEDRYFEYVDMSKGESECRDYMSGKDFDYMIVNTNTDLYKYMKNLKTYTQVLEGKEYVLFKHN